MNSGRLVSWGGLVLLCGTAVLAAMLEVLLIPLRAGSILVPVTIVFAVAGNVVLPRLARVLLDTTGAMVAPFVAWLLPVLILSLYTRPEGDVLVSGNGGDQWVFYGVLLGGAAAGAATLVLQAPAKPARPAAVRPSNRSPRSVRH